MLRKIPEAELKIMKFIWEENDTVISKDVTFAMEQKYGWKQTTTLTLLSRLVKKGFLEANKMDRYTHYTTVVEYGEYKDFETMLIGTNIHDNSFKSWITSLINTRAIPEDKVEYFKEIFKDNEDE
ncbi:BlaI/MecI/CopY family transcriptional regulator [Clostridioides difficile]|uniref:BlaI/MecI/CopY family transcriptional regulator n=1 Tax=Clostridioides difficile TaxID=1496 RepID=UPI0010B04FA7|nr:BlaI/MecI/CopY family transcriptional regulator [Clostridioides difficile]EGT2204150.1 BlaI/MecI/CopY family transcriptional regulator [Clostridioides difficile]EGT4665645.1 BlaI/MecI/CopY family transcriptional regulator [Clostridioides difficile]MBH7041545.1 BlaI/MecI/CopY family transcriptional regulator [Clostridioides difficile]MCA0683251.1 BlaI/MecI/CopY family transcriptional regulator [Clostridioides difficile]MCJ0055834.1 BlaI/MecI/CopY family transcriptional regulator [Clostridioi